MLYWGTGAHLTVHGKRYLQFLQPLQAEALGVLGVTGRVRHVPIISHGHWVVAGYGLVGHAGRLV